jgi:Uma2 family endonuclease
MTIALQRLTLQDYLHQNDGTDTRYELVLGERIPMSLGSGLYGEIAHLLEKTFEQHIADRALDWVARKGMIGVQSPQRGRWDTVRIPDITILPKTQWQMIRSREAVILLNESPPLLVVEVVSPSTVNTDYRAKRTEYALLGILEYWIVDPLLHKIVVCTLIDGFYDTTEFKNSDSIQSPIFPNWSLTAERILDP